MSIYIWTSEIKNIYVWTTPVKEVYVWTTKIRPKLITTSWIYHNSTLWLISLSKNGTSWYTISDKHLWATQVYNTWDTLSEANCWKYYQWWNNYGFPFTWATSTTGTRVSAAWYWPWNYYSSNKFIIENSGNWWDTSFSKNLWWWETGTVSAMQWPCQSGYHIPTKTEVDNIVSIWVSLWAWTSSWGTNFMKYLKIPLSWRLNRNTGAPFAVNAEARFWTTIYGNTNGNAVQLEAWSNHIYTQQYTTWFGLHIRPFKNVREQPIDDWTWTKLY